MRIHLLAAGVAVAALIPSLALAQPSCEQRRSQQTVGTIAGAGIGAVLGGAIAGRDDRAAGAIIGGLAGGVAGNQLSKPGTGCAHAYGYYDNRGRWVRVDASGERQSERARGDISSQQIWLDQRIHRGLNDGSLTRYEGDRALRTLASIGRHERSLRNRGGQLRPRDEAMIQARLDDLTESVRIMGRGPVRQY